MAIKVTRGNITNRVNISISNKVTIKGDIMVNITKVMMVTKEEEIMIQEIQEMTHRKDFVIRNPPDQICADTRAPQRGDIA